MDGSEDPVELLAQALLREYMHKKGFRATLAQYDLEQPRTAKSISSRLQMSRMLDLSPNGAAYPTFMEMMINARLLLLKPRGSSAVQESVVQFSSSPESPKRKPKIYRMKSEVPDDEDPHYHSLPSEPSSTLSPPLSPDTNGTSQLLAPPTAQHEKSPRPITATTERPAASRRSPFRRHLQEAAESDAVEQRGPPQRPRQAFRELPTRQSEVLVEDLGYLDERPAVRPPPLGAGLAARGEALGPQMARQIKRVLFGDRPWATSWVHQGFHFSQHVPYGLVQNEGGPCGPMAVVQAHFLKHLLYGGPDAAPPGLLSLSTRRRHEALAVAIASILMNIAERAAHGAPTIFLAFLPSSDALLRGPQVECFVMLACRTPAAAVAAILERLTQYTDPKGQGLLLFLVSALLTKVGSVQDVDWSPLHQEMDFPGQPLVVEHGYSGQELINLLLNGSAVSNVFDGVTELPGEKKDEVLRLRGIERPTDLGFLTLFEHYGSCWVGDRLKNPKHPCWVVCSESHFSVLFAKEAAAIVAPTFDIFHYDQLGMQDTEIRLTVDTTGTTASSVSPAEDLVPPLDLVLRTRWPGASVNWNETEPLL